MKTIEKMQFDKESIEKLKEDLMLLRKYLNYKKAGFCKRFLDEIIKNYFKK